jgi:hypothetical protein
MKAPFEAWDMTAVAHALADAMGADRRRCQACARALDDALEHASRVAPVARYETRADVARHFVRFADAFAAWDDFVAAVREGEDAGALEVALEILSRTSPAKVLPIARVILRAKPFHRPAGARPWKQMGARVGWALSRVDDPAAVKLALAHLDVPYITTAIAEAVCARAEGVVIARLETSPANPDRNETQIVEALLAYLGRHRVERAWSTVARLYEKSEDEHVRLGAGHALLAYGDERSREILTRSMTFPGLAPTERWKGAWRCFFGVKAALQRGPASALDALGGLDALRKSSTVTVASELLEQVASDARKAERAIEDARYLDLALAWVKDPRTKDVAQWVLDVFGKAKVAAAKKRLAKAGTLAKQPAPRKPAKADVAAVRKSMRRARANLERVVVELRALGYTFDAKPLGTPASAKTVDAIEKALGGPMPVSLRAAFEILGPCNLMGAFPGHPRSLESDAFVLVDAKSALSQALDEGGREAQVSLGIAPDAVGKAGFSGGQEAVLVPDGSLDARVIGIPKEPFFLDRLRHVFRWGGFPGLARAKGKRGVTVRRLAAVCEPI